MRALTIASALALSACAAEPAAAPRSASAAGQDCALSPADQAWVDTSMDAWNYTAHSITGVGRVENLQTVIFDANCVLTSSTAMNGGPKTWSVSRHDGQVPIPGDQPIPAQVTSFASAKGGKGFFVMSTPSVWRAGKVDGGSMGLEMLMVGVLLHEGTHVAQVPTYGKRIGALEKAHNLPKDFNDDSIQKRFEGEAEFASSIAREIDLLLSASAAKDDSEALRLAREAREHMKVRQARWYKGADSYLAEAEDIWLTFEGSAQWAGYQWLIDSKGGGISPTIALPAFGKRSKWWSQKEGFALFMALDRLVGPRWKQHAFGDGAKTGLQMLDEALDTPA